MLSDLRLLFATKLSRVKTSLYTDAVNRKWFTARPDKVRTRWRVLGGLLTLATVVVLTLRTDQVLTPQPDTVESGANALASSPRKAAV